MPTETAATWSLSTGFVSMSRARIHSMQSRSATQPPVIDAVRVPPSAWMTSQSIDDLALAEGGEIDDGAERPADQPLDLQRAARLLAGRRLAAGALAWSRAAACRIRRSPSPCRPPRSHGGTLSSRLAVHSTWVSPKRTRHEPSACLATPRSRVTGRKSVGAAFRRPDDGCFDLVPCPLVAAAPAQGKAPLEIFGRRPTLNGGRARTGTMSTQPTPTFRLASGPTESQPSALQALDRRSREIFRRIVDSYLETGEPVGSRNISRILPMSLSPASVRNVMADLEQLGLIYAPHTSAGRLPTEFGLRFFVDALLEVGDLSADERRRDRGAGEGGRRRADRRSGARRGEPGAFRPLARRRRRARRQGRSPPEARRVRPPRTDARAGRPGRRGRLGREPADRPRAGHDALGADRGRATTSTPTSAAARCPRRRPNSNGGPTSPAPNSTSSPSGWSRPDWRPGPRRRRDARRR